GNGDLETRADALRMQQATGCQGWMIGRAALGAPWIFAQLMGVLPEGLPPLPFRAAVAWRHVQLTQKFSPLSEYAAALELRGQLTRCRLDVRDQLVNLTSYAEACEILAPLALGLSWEQHLARA